MCCIFEGVLLFKFDEAKIRELWTELQERKCFKGSNPLWRQRRGVENKGSVAHTPRPSSVHAYCQESHRKLQSGCHQVGKAKHQPIHVFCILGYKLSEVA